MINLSVPMPEGAFSALRLDPAGLAREMRVAAAIQWYAQGRISQDMAAQIVGLNRAGFSLVKCRSLKCNRRIGPGSSGANSATASTSTACFSTNAARSAYNRTLPNSLASTNQAINEA